MNRKLQNLGGLLLAVVSAGLVFLYANSKFSWTDSLFYVPVGVALVSFFMSIFAAFTSTGRFRNWSMSIVTVVALCYIGLAIEHSTGTKGSSSPNSGHRPSTIGKTGIAYDTQKLKDLLGLTRKIDVQYWHRGSGTGDEENESDFIGCPPSWITIFSIEDDEELRKIRDAFSGDLAKGNATNTAYRCRLMFRLERDEAFPITWDDRREWFIYIDHDSFNYQYYALTQKVVEVIEPLERRALEMYVGMTDEGRLKNREMPKERKRPNR